MVSSAVFGIPRGNLRCLSFLVQRDHAFLRFAGGLAFTGFGAGAAASSFAWCAARESSFSSKMALRRCSSAAAASPPSMSIIGRR